MLILINIAFIRRMDIIGKLKFIRNKKEKINDYKICKIKPVITLADEKKQLISL